MIVTPVRGSKSKLGKRLNPDGKIKKARDQNGNIIDPWKPVGEQDLDDSEFYLNQVLHIQKLGMYQFYPDKKRR